jgi:glycosyltransferase EpsD
MAEKIKYLAENSSLQGIFGESGREIIKNNYAVNKVLEEKSYIYTMFMSGTEALDWIVH